MDVDHVPELVGNGMRLRGSRGGDISRRASLGRNVEIARGFGENLEADEPMTQQDAAVELGRRFGPGPHWVIADVDDVFVGVVRLAPVDVANRSARLEIGILDPARLGQGIGTQAIHLALRWRLRAPRSRPRLYPDLRHLCMTVGDGVARSGGPRG